MLTATKAYQRMGHRPLLGGLRLSKLSTAVFVIWISASIFYPRYLAINIAGISITLLNLIYLSVLVYCVCLLLFRPQLRSRLALAIASAPILYALISGEIVWQALCSAVGISSTVSFGLSFKYWVNIVSGFFIASVFFQDANCRRLFQNIFLVGTLIVCVIGVYEKIAGHSFLGQLHLEEFASNADVVAIYTGGNARDGVFRASSVFTHAIVFGQFAAAALVMNILAAMYARGKLRKLGTVAVPVVVAAVYASGSRSPIIVVLTSLLVGLTLVVIKKNNPVTILFYAVSGVSFGLFIYWLASDYIQMLIAGRSAIEIGSSNARSMMVQNGLNVIQQSPLFGFGAGMSLVLVGISTGAIRTIDNFFISDLVDFGFGGLTLTVLIFALILFKGFSTVNRLQGSEDRWFAISLTAFCAGIFVGQYVLSIYDNLFFVYVFAAYFVCTVSAKGRVGSSLRFFRVA